MSNRLGVVVQGSLNKGVKVRLDNSSSVESIAVGQYVSIQGEMRRFFGMITDISLGLADPELAIDPPHDSDTFLTEVVSGTSTYATIHVVPMLTVGGDAESLLSGPQPVKTVPSHFSRVSLASEQDIELVFGKEDRQRFWIGNPLDMETKLCLNLEELVKRSNGVFGKSGTGKTFLTRILLIGMLQKSKAVNLVFDMHNEYGWAGSSEGEGGRVKGLKQLFPAKVAVFALDEKKPRGRDEVSDFVVKIGYREITPEDLSILRETLNLTDLAIEAAYSLRRRLGRDWLLETLGMTDSDDISTTLQNLSIHESTFQSLRRGLATIRRLPFIEPEPAEDAVDNILKCLGQGKNVVLEFGRYRDITTYMLVANLLTRRIYDRYQQRTENALAEGTAGPAPLVITIEEAHKFLSPQVASQAIFGTIAREMRKYNVTLLVIDQRPSGIDEEVMSQLGTKITCLLDNERDIDSVLAGVPGKSELRSVLSRLAARQQALVFGHAVPMPVAFRPREYGSAGSYQGFMPDKVGDRKEIEKDIEDLWR